MNSSFKLIIYLSGISYIAIFSNFLWSRSPKCTETLDKDLVPVRSYVSSHNNEALGVTNILNFTTAARSAGFSETFYENDFLKCEKVHSNGSLLPDRINENIPRKSYQKCGVQNLLKPNSTLFEEKVWMLFLVKSAPDNIQLRHSIRNTWSTVTRVEGKKFVTIFLLAKSPTRFKNELLQQENEAYSDMLQCDHIDSYSNMTLKVLSGFRWLLASGIEAEHVTFCDDDVAMNIASIDFYFKKIELQKVRDVIICGHKVSEANTQRVNRDANSKWFISEYLYDKIMFPTFCHGAMWTLTTKLVHDLYCTAEVTNATHLHIDDVFVTGILRYKSQIPSNHITAPKLSQYKSVELMTYLGGEKPATDESMRYHWIKYYRDLMENKYLPKEIEGARLNIDPSKVFFRFVDDVAFNALLHKWSNG